jgi:hypothetical protein
MVIFWLSFQLKEKLKCKHWDVHRREVSEEKKKESENSGDKEEVPHSGT